MCPAETANRNEDGGRTPENLCRMAEKRYNTIKSGQKKGRDMIMKKTVCLIVTLALLLTAAACGSSDADTSAASDGATDPASAAQSDTADTSALPESTSAADTSAAQPESTSAADTSAAQPPSGSSISDAIPLAVGDKYYDFAKEMYFRISVAQESIIYPWIEGVSYSHMLFSVFDSNGAEITPENVYNKNTGVALPAGEFYLCINDDVNIYGKSIYGEGNYVYYEAETVGKPVNTSKDSAVEMLRDEDYSFTFTPGNGGERWYRFTLTEKSDVEIWCFDLSIEVSGADGAAVTADDSNIHSSSFRGLEPGEYFVKLNPELAENCTWAGSISYK